MEAERYRRVCRWIDQASPHGRRKREQFSDRVVAKVYFWSTLCDRPVSWACDRQNWPRELLNAFGELPSQSTMSRRLQTVGVRQLVERTQVLLSERLDEVDIMKVIDSKPLVVGNYSKDRDARRGRAAGTMARGYKIHVITCGKAVKHWTLLPMNCNDQTGAAKLLPELANDSRGWGYVCGDNGYDANPVHRLCQSVNHQLLAPPRKSNKDVRDTRRNDPARIRALDALANPLGKCGLGPSFGQSLFAQRKQIERNFGHFVMDGLHAPPPWVRRPHRVALWVVAKFIQRMDRSLQIAGVKP